MSSCITKKKKEDLSFLSKRYHNLTSKYNGYFNANVLYDQGILTANLQHNDNYAKILDMYPYMAIENPKSLAPEMDKIVEKSKIPVEVGESDLMKMMDASRAIPDSSPTINDPNLPKVE